MADRAVPIALLSPANMLLLGGATALSSLAIQMFAPAMPAMAADLSTSASVLQLGIAIYLFGLAGAQLVGGAFVDSHGRKPALLIGIGGFALGSLMAAIASGGAILLAGRLLQAVGGALTLVAGRAVVADAHIGESAPRSMAALSLIALLSPTISPSIGGWIVYGFGWRWIFIFLLALAVLIGIGVWRSIRELPRARVRSPGLSSYVALARRPLFVGLVIGNGCISFGFFIYLTSVPFFMADGLGMNSASIGMALLWIAGSVMLGTLAHRWSRMARYWMRLGLACIGIGTAMFVAVSLILEISLITLVSPMCMVALGAGLCTPINLSMALNIDRARIGVATSIFGAVQSLLSALGSGFAALVQPDTVGKMASMVATGLIPALLCLSITHVLRKR